MRLLAIESSARDVGVALADEAGPIACMTVRSGRRHAELLHPLVEQVCEVAGVTHAALEAIAVDVGPGLFTGIRVGVAAAKGFAMALGIPVVPLTSLEILRAACQDVSFGSIVPVVDLRRGEVAWCLPGGSMEHGTPARLAVLLDSIEHPVLLAGDGALRYAEDLRASRQDEDRGHTGPWEPPGARGLSGAEARGHRSSGGNTVPVRAVAGADLGAPPVASLAVRGVTEVRSGRAIEPLAVVPVYLRDADARINWTTRHDAPARYVAAAGAD
jgi:tRNA threonylcarbamoyladenosine biosynthesis protein TsaB